MYLAVSVWCALMYATVMFRTCSTDGPQMKWLQAKYPPIIKMISKAAKIMTVGCRFKFFPLASSKLAGIIYYILP